MLLEEVFLGFAFIGGVKLDLGCAPYYVKQSLVEAGVTSVTRNPVSLRTFTFCQQMGS
jgi:hypothetical protein